MRLRSSLGAFGLAAATVLATAARAAETPESLQRQAAAFARSCREPSETWTLKDLTRNFQPCNGAMTAFLKAIKLSKKDQKTIKAVSPPLTVVDIKLVTTAFYLGRLYDKRRDRAAAVRYLHVACSDAVLSFTDTTKDPKSMLMVMGTQAEALLYGYHEKCDPGTKPD